MQKTTWSVTPEVADLLQQLPSWLRRDEFLRHVGLLKPGYSMGYKVKPWDKMSTATRQRNHDIQLALQKLIDALSI